MSSNAPPPTADEGNARLRRLVDEHFDAVYRAVKRFGAPPSLADDAAQQVFLVAASKLSAIEPASERAFLFGTAFRVAKELRRRADEVPPADPGERALLSEPDPAPDPEELIDRTRARLLLDDLLAEMPDDLRAVFVLYEIEGLTVPELATALALAQGTVASRLRRARESFEQGLARHQAKHRFRAERALNAPSGREQREG
jgi:RNA polymerase sigma-70 factor (ECF subfamily)